MTHHTPNLQPPEQHGEMWAAIGTRPDRLAYLLQYWPTLVEQIVNDADESRAKCDVCSRHPFHKMRAGDKPFLNAERR